MISYLAGQAGRPYGLREVVQVVDEVREDGARGKLDRAAGTVVDQQREGDALEQFAGRRPRHAADLE